MKNWYRVAYSIPGAKRMRLIFETTEEAAIERAKELTPDGWMFEALLILQGTRV